MGKRGPEIRAKQNDCFLSQASRDTLGGMAAVVQQLRTNPGLYDGLYGFCGWAWKADGTFYVQNVTKNGQCSGTVNQTTTPIAGGADMLAEVKRQNMDFQPVVGLEDPEAAMKSMNESGADSKYITSFVAAAKQHGWKGFNLDWEGRNTTSTRKDFLDFMTLMNQFADAFAKHGMVFSSDIQWPTQWCKSSRDMSELTALLGATRAKLVPMDTCVDLLLARTRCCRPWRMLTSTVCEYQVLWQHRACGGGDGLLRNTRASRAPVHRHEQQHAPFG